MSQIEMKELKDWLNDPTALKFKKILLNSRIKFLPQYPPPINPKLTI